MKPVKALCLLSILSAACPPWASEARAEASAIMQEPCPPQRVPSDHLRKLLSRFLEPGASATEIAATLGKDPELQELVAAQREQAKHDWANLCRYRAQNREVTSGPYPIVVYLGDSITENWALADPQMFSGIVLGRGISGQTSQQMLLRFYQDVVSLHPRVVHIMAGTNDIAGNTGPTAPGDFEHNISGMLDMAAANDIRVVLAAVPPARLLTWAGIDPRQDITRINRWLADEALRRGIVFVDYAAVLATAEGAIQPELSADGVHPNRLGYTRMRPLAEAAVLRARRQKSR